MNKVTVKISITDIDKEYEQEDDQEDDQQQQTDWNDYYGVNERDFG